MKLPSSESCSPYLLEVFVVVDVLSLCGILQPVATDVLPHGIDDIRPLGRVDAQQASQFAGQLVLNRLE